MKAGRKPEYPERTPGDELQKMPHTTARIFKPQARLEPAQLHWWQSRKADMLTVTPRVAPTVTGLTPPGERSTAKTGIKPRSAALWVDSLTVVFLSCPLVKKHADLFGSFLYSQSTMKDMYSKPTNRTELSIPIKTKSLA